MAFLSGSVGFERFKVTGVDFKHFKEEHIEILSRFAAGPASSAGAESVTTGFIAVTTYSIISSILKKM